MNIIKSIIYKLLKLTTDLSPELMIKKKGVTNYPND